MVQELCDLKNKNHYIINCNYACIFMWKGIILTNYHYKTCETSKQKVANVLQFVKSHLRIYVNLDI